MNKLFLIILCCGIGFVSDACARVTQGFVAGDNHVRIHYREDGPRGAPLTIVLIPGWRVSSLIWTTQLRYFGGLGDRVIAIDSRSQGGSGVVYCCNSPEDRAKDIREVIEHLHLTHVTLVGWSQGAQDVSAYINRFGTDRVDDLVLVDSPVSSGPPQTAGDRKFMTVILRGIALYSRDPKAYSQGMMHAIISVPTPSATMHELVRESMRTPVDVGISMLVQDLFTVDRRPYVHRFTVPTLVIASSRSPLLEEQQQMAAQLPKGRFVTVHGAAHAVFFDRPTVFDHVLEAFVTNAAANRHAQP